MRFKSILCQLAACLLGLLPSGAARGQNWEIGGGAGGSFYSGKTVQGAAGTATTGFRPGFTAAAWLGQNVSRYIGGDLRYRFSKNDLKLSSGGSSVNFGGQSHSLEYDVLVHFRAAGSNVRPYVLGGGGIKNYRGMGTERALQPLVQFAAFTHTAEWKGMATFGGGVKFDLSPRVRARVEFLGQASPFPKEVIAPAPGRRVDGWIHNFLPWFGISYIF